MESILGRYRNLVILVGVLFLQILGLAVQVKRSSDTENTRLIRVWAVDMVTPFERVLIWAQNGTGGLWHNYIYLRGVRAENRQLKDQIEQLRLEQVRLNEDAVQAHRLQALLAFKEQFISKTVAAQVIGSSGTDTSRILYIDKGDKDHLKRDMAVITSDGVVGKVLQVFPSVSQVLLINDQSSGVGTILEKSRLQGFLKGAANGEVALEGVMSDEQVAPGEKALTSGGDQIFPKGLLIGTVTNVATGKDLFLNIAIKPAVNLSKLEEVLVVVERQERQATTEDLGRVRAADILARRLPSVPDKPPVTANSPSPAPAGSVAAPGTASRTDSPVAAPKQVSTNAAGLTKPAKSPSASESVARPQVASGSGQGRQNSTQSATPNAAPPTTAGRPDAVTTSKPASAAPTQPKPRAAQSNPAPAKVAPAVLPAQPDPANAQDSPH
ncbi:MAG TPA: rod shape-determining protein MreC [Candidatus Sulfotelmatobacter sp.]|nr:rod shape-determining protein MreC [Candidatus Sulfotelmatobacter sp.]